MATQSLEAELFSLLGGDTKARIVARYCGFDGAGGTTLQMAGAEFGISAERVRQIVGEVVQRKASGPAPAPLLRQAIELVVSQAPDFAAGIEAAIQTAGLSASPFKLEGLLRAAELCGIPAGFSVTATQHARLVHTLSPPMLDAVVREARRGVERRGLVNIHHLVKELAGTQPRAASARLVVGVLTAIDDLRWLAEPGDWFWLPSVSRNPVVRRICKILSVANPVSFSVLYAMVTREDRLIGDPPPPAVLRDLCGQLAGLRCDADCVAADPPLDPGQLLGEVELELVKLLREHGGAMRRTEMGVECSRRGINRSSFYCALAHSPVIVRRPGGMLALIGAAETASPVANTASHRSKYLHANAGVRTIRLNKWLK